MIKRMDGNTATLNFSAFNGYIIKVNEEDDSQVWVQYFFPEAGETKYNDPELMDLDFYYNPDTRNQEVGFVTDDELFFLTYFMRDNYMAGVK